LEELRVVLFGQPLTKQLERRQMQRARLEQRVHHWKSPPKSRSQDAAKRFTFAKPKLLEQNSNIDENPARR
jgi:type II secretory pathway predicted ATPase ExeA